MRFLNCLLWIKINFFEVMELVFVCVVFIMCGCGGLKVFDMKRIFYLVRILCRMNNFL